MEYLQPRNHWCRVAELLPELTHLRDLLNTASSIYPPQSKLDWWVFIAESDETIDKKTTLPLAAANEKHLFFGPIVTRDRDNADTQEDIFPSKGDRLNVSVTLSREGC